MHPTSTLEGDHRTQSAISCSDLSRTYQVKGTKRGDATTEIIALADVSLEIAQGELFGLLGPNGAGKTTLIKILATLLLPTSGEAHVNGLDVATEERRIRRDISLVSGGETSGYGLLTVEENLWMFARFYGLDSRDAKQRIGDLMELVGIADRRRSKISDLSTGLRQKMNFVRGFVSDPKVVFLDEPTLGLDVGAARDVRAFVKDWIAARDDRTILLTTHYMAEADEMCDRLAIIDQGRLLALDTPEALKRQLRRDVVFTLEVEPLGHRPTQGELLEAVPGVRQLTVTERDGSSELQLILDADDVLPSVLAHLDGRGSKLISLQKREPTLEDVFIDLVGRGLDVDTSHRGAGDDG